MLFGTIGSSLAKTKQALVHKINLNHVKFCQENVSDIISIFKQLRRNLFKSDIKLFLVACL